MKGKLPNKMLIRVKVKAGAKTEKIEKLESDRFLITVREEAEGNRANRRILEIIRQIFGAKKVSLRSGHHKPSKIINVE